MGSLFLFVSSIWFLMSPPGYGGSAMAYAMRGSAPAGLEVNEEFSGTTLS